MPQVKSKINIAFLSVFTILLGFLREYLFGNINWIYKTLTKNRVNQARDEFQFLLNWNPEDIIALKWMLTVIFFTLFMFLTYLIIRLGFKNKIYSRATLMLFGTILLVSGFFYLTGYIFSIPEKIYPIIRTLMGIGQSFIPLMILFVLFKFFPSSKID